MFTLENKPNWAETRERFMRWWKQEPTDRPLVMLAAPLARPRKGLPVPPEPETPEQKWLAIDAIIARHKARFDRIDYLADSFPYIDPALGPGSLGTFLGARPEMAMHTVWYEKCFEDPAAASARFDPDSNWWQWTLDYTRHIMAARDNDFLPAFPDLIENMDTLAAMLGTIELVYAANDSPDEIHRLMEEVTTSYFKAYDGLTELMYPDRDESVFMGFNIWAAGRCTKMQCDIAALLSPDVFAEFVVPYFQKQCARLDYVLYHLDGPDAIYTLDQLLEIDGIDAIQWVPGAGKPAADSGHWDSLFHRILDAGKSIWSLVSPGNAKAFKKRFGSKGVFMEIGWMDSADEARALMRDLSV